MLNILNELAATTKTNEKLAILQKYESDHLVATVFRLAYSPTIKYWIKKRPEPVKSKAKSVAVKTSKPNAKKVPQKAKQK